MPPKKNHKGISMFFMLVEPFVAHFIISSFSVINRLLPAVFQNCYNNYMTMSIRDMADDI